MSKIRDFFWGDKNTLVHSIVDGAIKSLFSAIVVAAAAILIIGALEDYLELSQRRAALLDLRNEELAGTLKAVSESYGALDCARERARVTLPDCKTGIDALIAQLRSRRNYLSALMPGGDFSSMDGLIEAAERLRGLRSAEGATDAMDAFEAAFVEMIEAVAAQFS